MMIRRHQPHRHDVRRVAAALALACVAALPLGAQVLPTPRTRTLPAPLPAAAGDLVITNVTVIQDGTGAIVAQLQIKNAGSAPVTIPGGSVIARGEVQGGSITFPPQKVGSGLQLAPGTMFSVSVPSSGWCPGGKPGPVTFRVNPDNTLPESDRRNNTFAVPASSLYGDITSAQVWLESQRFPADGVTGRIPAGQRNTLPRGAAADIVVEFRNAGPGYLVVCSGATLLRDVQSPMSALFGLKTYKSPISLIVRPGGGSSVKLQGAVGPVVLEPGSYPWQFLLNPESTIAESNADNNAATATVRVTPPIQ